MEVLELHRQDKFNGSVHYDTSNEIYYTKGEIGEYNEFNTLIEVLEHLQGFDVHLDEIFFN